MKTLIVMVKEPRPGRVKTRLGQDIGMIDAAWWFRHQTRTLLRTLSDRRWRTILAVSPDRAGLTSRVWPAALPRLPQGRGDLGARMLRVARQIPQGPVLIIGADIPQVGPHHIARGFHRLGGKDAIFGPATDGGFWLMGLRHPQSIAPHALSSVRWSSPFALQDTLACLPGRRIGFADTLRDVDTLDDLRMTGRPMRARPGI